MTGSGYISIPTVTISGGGGNGATAMAHMETYIENTVRGEKYTIPDSTLPCVL